MPRKHPLPPGEEEICRRVRFWREQHQIPRVPFAKIVGIDSSTLAAIEYARQPLRYRTAYAFMTQLSLNPHWLATGEGLMHARIFAPTPEQLGTATDPLFSEVFRQHMQPRDTELHFPGGPIGRELARQWLDDRFTYLLAEIPDPHLDSFVADIAEKAESELRNRTPWDSKRIVEERRKRMEQLRAFHFARGTLAAQKNVRVDNPEVKRYLTRVTVGEHWNQLRDRLNEMLSSPGEKATLAKALGVSKSAVSQWLSGKTAPSAELALCLREWVYGPDEQGTNAPAGGTNTRKGGQTRTKKQANESKSGPPRKE